MATFKFRDDVVEDKQIKNAQVMGVDVVDDKQGIVDALVAVIGNVDHVGDVIVPGAFDRALKRRKPKAVLGHDWNKPVGKILDMEEIGGMDPRLPDDMRSKGWRALWARIQFNMKSNRGQQAFCDVDFYKDEQEWSIGYKTLNKPKKDPRNGANILSELELFEVSPVLHGANSETRTTGIKSLGEVPEEMGWIREGLKDKYGGPVKVVKLDLENNVVWYETAPGVVRKAALVPEKREVEIEKERRTRVMGRSGEGLDRNIDVKSALSGYELSIECAARDAAYIVWALDDADALADISDKGVDIRFGGDADHIETQAEVVLALAGLMAVNGTDEVPEMRVRDNRRNEDG